MCVLFVILFIEFFVDCVVFDVVGVVFFSLLFDVCIVIVYSGGFDLIVLFDVVVCVVGVLCCVVLYVYYGLSVNVDVWVVYVEVEVV